MSTESTQALVLTRLSSLHLPKVWHWSLEFGVLRVLGVLGVWGILVVFGCFFFWAERREEWFSFFSGVLWVLGVLGAWCLVVVVGCLVWWWDV